MDNSPDSSESFSVTPDGISVLQQMIAACSGALVTSLFVNPLDVVKIRMQKQVKHGGSSPKTATSSSATSKSFFEGSAHHRTSWAPSYDLYRKFKVKGYVTPLDVIKVRLQAQRRPMTAGSCFIYCNGLMDHICKCEPLLLDVSKGIRSQVWYARPSNFSGTIDAFVKITKSEGVRSLWSGLPPTLVMAIPATVVYFTSYDNTLNYLKRNYNYNIWMPLLSGGAARTLCVTLISPLEMIRTKQQSEKLKYKDLWQAIRKTTSEKGLRSLYTGLGPTLLRDVPFSCIYWAFYETVKGQLNDVMNSKFSLSFVSGAIAGTLAAIATCPFDVIKTHRQIELGEREFFKVNETSTWKLLRRLKAQNGLKSLFSGLTPRVIKVAPACAIMIGTYEYLKTVFREQNDLKKKPPKFMIDDY